MLQKPKCPVIALEEHYWDQELAGYAQEIERNPKIAERLFDLGAMRLKEMDEAGVDVQVLSHGAPSGQALDSPDAAAIVARVNDRIAEFIKTKPDRFSAFGALATCDPTAAADELERVVTRHGFKGAMIHGLTKGQFVTTGSSGRFSSVPRSSTCRSICIRRFLIRR